MTHSNTEYQSALRRRRDAASRLPPLDNGLRDPWATQLAPPGCSDFSLTPTELVREVQRLSGRGWQTWELMMRLQLPGAA